MSSERDKAKRWQWLQWFAFIGGLTGAAMVGLAAKDIAPEPTLGSAWHVAVVACGLSAQGRLEKLVPQLWDTTCPGCGRIRSFRIG